MLNVSVYLYLSAIAIAMYFATSVQYLELVFDHYYRYMGLGLAVFGLTLGFALSAAEKESGFRILVDKVPVACVFIAAIGQVLAWYVAFNMTYGAAWTFLLLALVLLVPYVFWGCTLSKVGPDDGKSATGKWFLVGGALTGLFSAVWLVDSFNSLSTVWLLSSSVLAFSVLPLAGKRRLLQGFLGVWVAAALLWLATTIRTDGYPQWDMSQGTVSKPVAAALASQKDLQIESTDWHSGFRIDQTSSKRSRSDGSGWTVVNGTTPVPFAHDAESRPYKWWLKRFPLAAFPLEVAEPERMLSIEAVPGPDGYMAALKGVREYEYLGYSSGCGGKIKPQCLSGVGEAVLADGAYDLIHLSVPHPLKSAWVGANTADEYLVSAQMLERYFAALNSGGMLAITAREEAIFIKLLVSVWHILLPDPTSNVMDLEDRLSVFRLNHYAPYKGSYRYLMLVTSEGFSTDQLGRIEEAGSRLPVEAIIYRNQVHKAPYRFFDNLMVSHSLQNVQQHFKRYVGWSLQSPVNLQPASRDGPAFFQLSHNMHPFLRWLMTGILALMVCGVLFLFRQKRNIEHPDQSNKPAVSVFLVQLLASAAGTAFLLNAVVQPVIAVMQIPLNGFLLAVSLALVAVVRAGQCADAGGGQSQKAVIRSTALILALLLSAYFLREPVFDFVQGDRAILPLAVASLLLAVVGWLSWRVHRHLMSQAQQVHSLARSWLWVLSGLGVLVGIVVSSQAWLQVGWSRLILSAGISYVVVFLVESWIVRSAVGSAPLDMTGSSSQRCADG